MIFQCHSGRSTYRFIGEDIGDGAVSKKVSASEVMELASRMSILVSNPVCVLTQERAKSLVHASPEDKYKVHQGARLAKRWHVCAVSSGMRQTLYAMLFPVLHGCVVAGRFEGQHHQRASGNSGPVRIDYGGPRAARASSQLQQL